MSQRFPALHEVLQPLAADRGVHPLPPAQLRDRDVPTDALHHDPDLVLQLRGICNLESVPTLLTTCTARSRSRLLSAGESTARVVMDASVSGWSTASNPSLEGPHKSSPKDRYSVQWALVQVFHRPPGCARMALGGSKRVEWADKPDSVVSVHLSGTAVARSLKRPTRGSCDAGQAPSDVAEATSDRPLFGLAPGGCFASRHVAAPLVRSYRTISPLPRSLGRPRAMPASASVEPTAVCFCATFRQVALPGGYPAPCPAESGLSSATSRQPRTLGPLRFHSTTTV